MDTHNANQNSQLRSKHEGSDQFRNSVKRENRSTAASAKGKYNKGKGTGANNKKHRLEDISVDADSMIRKQLLMDSSLGLAAAVHTFGIKKSVTTKN